MDRARADGEAVPVRTVCLTTYDADGYATDEWGDE